MGQQHQISRDVEAGITLRTPAEVWNGVDVYRRVARRRIWFEAWEGLLQGEYLQF
jgi:hypothetical protein